MPYDANLFSRLVLLVDTFSCPSSRHILLLDDVVQTLSNRALFSRRGIAHHVFLYLLKLVVVFIIFCRLSATVDRKVQFQH
jgi:hypothetical protein